MAPLGELLATRLVRGQPASPLHVLHPANLLDQSAVLAEAAPARLPGAARQRPARGNAQRRQRYWSCAASRSSPALIRQEGAAIPSQITSPILLQVLRATAAPPLGGGVERYLPPVSSPACAAAPASQPCRDLQETRHLWRSTAASERPTTTPTHRRLSPRPMAHVLLADKQCMEACLSCGWTLDQQRNVDGSLTVS
jgi:hypothetical protein